MGFFDRFKKKAKTENKASSEVSSDEVNLAEENVENIDTDSLIDSVAIDDEISDSFTVAEENEDPLSSLDPLDPLDPLEEQDEQAAPKEAKPKKFPIKIIIGIIFAFFFFLMLIVAGYFLLRKPDYQPLVEKSLKAFFLDLGKGDLKSVYDAMLPELGENFSLEKLELEYRKNRYILADIVDIEFQATRYDEKQGIGIHAGRLTYSDNLEGFFTVLFEVRKVENTRKVLLKGFKIESDTRKNKYFKEAYKVVKEFIATFENKKLEQFKGFLYPKIKEALGNLKMNLLHSRLAEAGFDDIVFKESEFLEVAPTELTFLGSAITKFDTRMRGEISLFFEDGVWLVTMVNFKPE